MLTLVFRLPRECHACHRITAELIRRFDVIAVEKLQIQHMTRSSQGTAEYPGRNINQKRKLNWSVLKQ